MKENIVNLIDNKITPEFLEFVSSMLGENRDDVKLALSGIIPFLLNRTVAHLQRADEPGIFLKELRETPEFNTQDFTLSALLKKSGPDSTIKNLLSLLTDNSHYNLEKTVINAAHTKPESASALISLGALLVFTPMRNYLNNRRQHSLSLKSWLQEQMQDRISPIPAAFISSLGADDATRLAAATATAAAAAAVTASAAPVAPPAPPAPPVTPPVEEKKSNKWLWLLPLLLLILLLFFLLRGCNDKETAASAPAADNASQSLWGDLGAFFSKALPDGRSLNIPQNGVENHLLDFITSDKPVDTTTWFSFDRLLFKTNSAQLEPASEEQLKNIAAILHAYPNVELRLGGYTDNTGTEEINMDLSQKRADAVRDALIALNADGNRISAKGYGSAHPVAPNDTDENRAKNRRIDILVTKK